MGRKFKVGDVVRVKERAYIRDQMYAKARRSFRARDWTGVVVEYPKWAQWYDVRSGTRGHGHKFPFYARELDLISRPKKAAK